MSLPVCMSTDWPLGISSYWASDVYEECLLTVLGLFVDDDIDASSLCPKIFDKTPLNIRRTHGVGYVK